MRLIIVEVSSDWTFRNEAYYQSKEEKYIRCVGNLRYVTINKGIPIGDTNIHEAFIGERHKNVGYDVFTHGGVDKRGQNPKWNLVVI